MPINSRMDGLWYIHTMKYVQQWRLTNYSYKQQHGCISQIKCWVKNARHRRVLTVWIYLYTIQKKRQNYIILGCMHWYWNHYEKPENYYCKIQDSYLWEREVTVIREGHTGDSGVLAKLVFLWVVVTWVFLHVILFIKMCIYFIHFNE